MPNAKHVNNLLAHFDGTRPRDRREYKVWYAKERLTCRKIARDFGITVRQAAGIVAAYSQNNDWEGNIRDVRTFLANPTNHGLALAYGPSLRILQGERPLDVLAADGVKYAQKSGRMIGFARDPFKLRNFYRALCGDPDALTMDRWAARAADPTLTNPKNEREYNALCEDYREAARLRRQRPADMQAIVWCAVRGSAV